MEALAHLKASGPDAVQQVQTAIAAAWSFQMDTTCRIPQLVGLTHILDVTCALRTGRSHEMLLKLKEMQTMMDEALKDNTWGISSENFAIPINRSKSDQVVSPDTRIILGIGNDGRDILMVSFLSKKDAYSITFV